MAAQDALMGLEEAKEVLSIFTNMAPVLNHLKPPVTDGREPKRARHPGENASEAAPQVLQVLQALTRLCLQLDRDAQTLRQQDTFIIFLANEEQAVLPRLIQETAHWKKMVENKTCTRPLRCVLIQAFLVSVQDRMKQLVQSAQMGKARQVAIEKGLLTSDGCWPFHRWDNVQHTLILDQKQALKFDQVTQLIDELIETATQDDWVLSFHSLKGGELVANKIIPWKLQISLRMQEPWRILCTLSQNQVWQTVGASLRQHTQRMSPAATHLQHCAGKGHGKAHYKGKGSKKGQ